MFQNMSETESSKQDSPVAPPPECPVDDKCKDVTEKEKEEGKGTFFGEFHVCQTGIY